MSALLNGIRLFLWRQDGQRLGVKVNPTKDRIYLGRGQKGTFYGSTASVTTGRNGLFVTVVTADGTELSRKLKSGGSRARRFVAQYNTRSEAHEEK